MGSMKKTYPRRKTSTTESDIETHGSSKASVTSSSVECAKVEIVIESCRQTNVALAESVKENSPDLPSVPHETQEEPQKPRVTLLRLPAEVEPYECECEQEAAEIVGMAEDTSGMLEKLRMLTKWPYWMGNR